MTHPRDWKVELLANVGADERFVRETLQLLDLLNGTLIVGQQRKDASGAIGTVLIDGLMPAFLDLRRIQELQNKELPLIDRRQPYEDFARKLWKAYKDLTQRAAVAMGFDIGFLFQDEPSSRKD